MKIREKKRSLQLQGRWKAECYGDDGKLKWVEEVPNGITDIGINAILDIAFRNQTQIATWYAGLIDNSGFTALAAADTMASHAGWSESVAYSDANRITWSTIAAASRLITNTTTMDFSINATATINGIFITSDNTKSGTSGTLWSTASFSTTRSVVNGDTLRLTYSVQG